MIYKVYLKTISESYKGPIYCNNLEEVEIVLENSEEYDEYLIIKRDPVLNYDESWERGYIKHDINKKMVKTLKNKKRKR